LYLLNKNRIKKDKNKIIGSVMNKTLKIAAVIIFITGIVVSLFFIKNLNYSELSAGALNSRLESIISTLVDKDKSIRNCVLAVMKGDESYSWAGAAGVARQDGQVPMTTGTPIFIASVLKLYTATVIMKLYETGNLSLDDPISKYLPEELIKGIHIYKGKDYSHEITIKQLLSQTSGIADYYTEKPEGGKSVFETHLEEPEREWKENETIEWARDKLKPHFPPGTDAYYSDTNFDLLGKIIESITGRPLHVVYEDLIFHPLGLTHTWLIERSAPQIPVSPSPADVFYKDRNITNIRSNSAYWPYMISTSEEMIIFLKDLNEGRIIKKETLELMHNWHKLFFPIQYGYGTMYFKLPWLMSKASGIPPLWGHSGSTGSFLYYSQDLDLYMAGTIDNVGSNIKPFMLMRGKVCKLFRAK
jgi:D-alanyl-D-alanine carboxypeptidase